MIRCNNCYATFETDEDLSVVFDVEDQEEVKGCPTCKTDGYLMDIEPEPKPERIPEFGIPNTRGLDYWRPYSDYPMDVCETVETRDV